MTAQVISAPMGGPVWMESTRTTVSVLRSGLVSTAPRTSTSAAYSPTLVKMEEHAVTYLAVTCVSVSMAGVDLTALKTSTTVPLQRAARAPPASTVWRPSSASVLTERLVCCATEMTLVSVTLVERAPTVTPTPSVACSTVTVPWVTQATPVTLTEMNVVLALIHVSTEAIV